MIESEKSNRMLEIFFRALHGEAISSKALAQEYQVSTKSIGRDISRIQNFLAENRSLMQNAELTYSHKEKGVLSDQRRIFEKQGAVCAGGGDSRMSLFSKRRCSESHHKAKAFHHRARPQTFGKAHPKGGLPLPRGAIRLCCCYRYALEADSCH
ncbi:MAG: hypothetical protein ACLUSL_12055 [Ruminococcus sp.]